MEKSKINVLMDFVGVYSYYKKLENGGDAFLGADRHTELKRVGNRLDIHLDKITDIFNLKLGTHQSDDFFNLMDSFTSSEDDSVDEFIDKMERLIG